MSAPTQPKIVFFDIDDTIFIKDENRIPASVAPALKALKAKGSLVAIATGRSLGVMPPLVQDLIDEVQIDLLLTMNGQYNQYHGRKLMDFPLATEQVLAITQELQAKGTAYACMTRDEIFAFCENDCLHQALGALNIQPQFANPECFDFNQTIYQMLAFYQEHDAPLLNLPPDIKTTRWHPCAVDVLDCHASKARAIGQVLARLGIAPDEAAAFGDGLNDLEMFDLVGTAIAMGNAHPTAQARADRIADRHDQDGIATELQNLGWI